MMADNILIIGNLLLALIRIVQILGTAGIIIFGIVKGIIFFKQKDFYGQKRTVLVSIICIIFVAISWILNFGWLRVFGTVLLIPVIHALIFSLINFFVAKYLDKSAKVTIINIFFIISYIIAYISLPDSGDVGETYFFFGLIHSDALSDIAFSISTVTFIVNFILMVMQLLMIRMAKKSRLENK